MAPRTALHAPAASPAGPSSRRRALRAAVALGALLGGLPGVTSILGAGQPPSGRLNWAGERAGFSEGPLAQSSPRTDAPPGPPAAPAPPSASPPSSRPPGSSPLLADEALELEGLALSIRPPVGSVVVREELAGQTALVMAEAGTAEPRWRLRIQSLAASPMTPSAKSIAEDHLRRLERSGRPFRVLSNEPATYGGATGHMLVLEEEGRDGAMAVNGWLVLPRGGLSYTVATLATTPQDLIAIRPVLEATLSSLVLEEMDDVLARRLRRLEAGERFLATLTPERLRSLAGLDEWCRLYRPAGPNGAAREVGYLHLRVAEARRGELSPGRSPSDFAGDELIEGLMLMAQSRGLLSDDGSQTLDIDARFWISWDRTMEAWSARSTERDGRIERSFAQTGVRTPGKLGTPPTLSVITGRAGVAPSAQQRPQEWSVPERTYLSVLEGMLLGALLPRDGGVSELSFFAFDTKERRLAQRVDRWRPAEDGSGNWVLTSQAGLDEPAVTQIYDPSGRRLKRLDPDGVVTERIELEELVRLWKLKGLPTGEERARRSGP